MNLDHRKRKIKQFFKRQSQIAQTLQTLQTPQIPELQDILIICPGERIGFHFDLFILIFAFSFCILTSAF